MKTSIKIKKLWVSSVAADGGIGSNWTNIELGAREATVQFNGSDADVSNYKNILGAVLESAIMKGDKTLVFQLADLNPEVVAVFTGGVVTSTSEADSYDAPDNENQSIELSVKFLTDKNVLFRMPRVAFDGYPMVNDDDLHYHQINGVVLQPSKSGVTSYGYDLLKTPSANAITAFSVAAQTGAATINVSAHTVAITVASGTVVTSLEPTIEVSLGASLEPNSGVAQDFTAAKTYTVQAADGTEQAWVVTVTVAA